MKLSGWGKFPILDANIFEPRDIPELVTVAQDKKSIIARGNGRAYGDSAISECATISMRFFNRLLAFNNSSGQLVAESGVILADIIATFLPQGWFPAVAPGTQFVTLGGMIAADVHGKNHHKEGGFRECVDWIDIIGIDGEVRRCSRSNHAELFDCTLGGMGLTGIILRVAIRLRSVETGWIRQKTIVASNLKAAMKVFEDESNSTYSVAWIDCLSTGQNLGRSVVMLGEHACLSDLTSDQAIHPFNTGKKRKISVPFELPYSPVNHLTVGLFNSIYYALGVRSSGEELVSWDSYFFPLDAILGWNRIYGRKGFVQYQCVLPDNTAEESISAILKKTADIGLGSFLAVLKRLGPQYSKFSFPMSGYTLALDFPVSPKAFKLLDTLDKIIMENGGRLYLAKDSRMSSRTLHALDNRAVTFLEVRRKNGWSDTYNSAQSERLWI